MFLIKCDPRPGRSNQSAVVAWMLLTILGCATVMGSWDYGLPKDHLSTEDRLWHIVFPLSLAAADQCVFKREDTYGFFLEDATKPLEGNSGQTTQPYVRIRYVHAQLPAGRAGMAINDQIVAINGDPITSQSAEAVSSQIQRLTRAKIQPLTLRLLHGNSEQEIHLWAVHSCRMNVKLIQSPIINALSDGSNIVVTTGLLEFVRSPDQLAWVLAHEVGHHVLEHAEEAKLQLMLNRFLSSTGGEASQEMRQIDLERQADLFAADLITRAGYDLREARRLLGWLEAVHGQPSSEDLRQSHPTNKERLEALDRMIRDLDEKRKRGEKATLQ
jgi:peptidase M48-like protein/PDZ domain-containing protein